MLATLTHSLKIHLILKFPSAIVDVRGATPQRALQLTPKYLPGVHLHLVLGPRAAAKRVREEKAAKQAKRDAEAKAEADRIDARRVKAADADRKRKAAAIAPRPLVRSRAPLLTQRSLTLGPHNFVVVSGRELIKTKTKTITRPEQARPGNDGVLNRLLPHQWTPSVVCIAPFKRERVFARAHTSFAEHKYRRQCQLIAMDLDHSLTMDDSSQVSSLCDCTSARAPTSPHTHVSYLL